MIRCSQTLCSRIAGSVTGLEAKLEDEYISITYGRVEAVISLTGER